MLVGDGVARVVLAANPSRAGCPVVRGVQPEAFNRPKCIVALSRRLLEYQPGCQ